ncbi:MAG: hypothetical protein JO222_09370 [Frankiales bacterium]|nr:hypothetical protein [Frankiales bacterium]
MRAALEAIERVIIEHAETLAPHRDIDGDWTSDIDATPLDGPALSGWVLVCDWTSLADGTGALVVEQPHHVSRPTAVGLLQLGLDARRGVGD